MSVSNTGADPGEWLHGPFLISPDSSRVVYRANEGAVGFPFELYSVPLAGGAAPVRLTFGATGNDVVRLLAISSDSATVVYLFQGSGRSDLFRVPIDGGSAPVRLNGALTVTLPSFVPYVKLDDGGKWLLFHAAPSVAGVHELFAVPLHGLGAPIRVNEPLAGVTPTTITGSFRPGTSSVAYLAEQDEAGVVELYRRELLSAGPRHRPR